MERIERATGDGFGVQVHDFDHASATAEDLALLAKAVHHEKLVILKHQQLSPADYVAFGRRLGTPVTYYEPMYAHPEHPEIFVSSNVPLDGDRVGVPRTGQFWHSDYQFTAEPFAITMLYPQALPSGNRCTFFVDMADAHARLPRALQELAAAHDGIHSARKYFKIRPDDVFRPIGEILREIDERTPPVRWPLVVRHPVTGESVLYVSEGFTIHLDDDAPPTLLDALLEATGQLDPTFTHPCIRRVDYEIGDLAIWDNRALVHRGLHVTTDEPAVSYRLTLADGRPLLAAAS